MKKTVRIVAIILAALMMLSSCAQITTANETTGVTAEGSDSSITSQEETTGTAGSTESGTSGTTEAGTTEAGTTAGTETADTETTYPETTHPQTTSPETTLPETTLKETSEPETTKPETTTVPATTEAETEGGGDTASGPRPNPSPVDPAKMPAYSGELYVAVNGNEPDFTSSDITDQFYEYYSPLDTLGRCGYAMACLGPETLPTGERGSISSIRPTGWVGSSIYNRSHLIAWSLSGEDANRNNLITGTTLMNQSGMTVFENMVLAYIRETGNHVIYRVTPLFIGSNLVASGVQMEAFSVEDDGDGICYNVYLYNVQPGYVINYATGELDTETVTGDEDVPDYVVNKSSKKFHYPTCSGVATMSDKNREDRYDCTREELIAEGYSPCGQCNP